MIILDLFSNQEKKYKIQKPIRLIELFAGIGSQAKALKRQGFDIKHHQVVEFDKYAIQSYNNIHGTNFRTQDITTLEKLDITETDKYDYILTYSFPCQDLSLAGKGQGMTKGKSTRSGLLWEVERLLEKTNDLPQILLLENVPQVIGSKHRTSFYEWVNFLARKGYSNFGGKLNAKDYGVAQNRDRVFMLSILGEYRYDFPKPFKLEKKLKDFLEDEVDEKYYLTPDMIERISKWNAQQKPFENMERINKTGIVPTLTARGAGEEHSGMILIKEYTLCARDYKDPKVLLLPEKTKKGYVEAEEGDGVYIDRPHQKRGVLQKQMIPTLKTSSHDVGVVVNNPYLRIRKITPKECFRLMGFDDEDYEKAAQVNSASQLYKQAGNSIVVDVLENIFKELK